VNQITITYPDICEQLTTVAQAVELVTTDGRRLGTFRPEPASGPVSLEEMQRRTTQPGGKTTAEVLEHLDRL